MATSLQQLSAFASMLIQQPTGIKIGITLTILLAGFLLSRLISRVFKRAYNAYKPDEIIEQIKQRKNHPVKYVEYLGSITTIGLALLYLNSSVTSQLYSQLSTYLPAALTSVLIFFLGIIVVKLVMNLLNAFIDTVGFKEYVKDLGFSIKVAEAFLHGLKAFLYLVVLEIAIIQMGVYSSDIIANTLTAASYGLVALLGALAFFGFKDLVQNYAAGIYLRGSDILKPGKKVKLDGESGEIREISGFSTTITTDSGYFMLKPNKELMDTDIMFKRVKADVETLEDIKNYFVAQEPSYCGPASAEMALAMFGYDLNQGTLAEESGTSQPGGVQPDDLIQAIESRTNGKVKAEFVEYDKITDLAEELKTWFNDGGLVVVNFAKPLLFPQADTGHYSLSVGVEGEEILIVDPSAHTMSGGVYYVDNSEMYDAMSEWEGRKRGYIIMAPEGTTAYWRIKEGLIYSDSNVYDQLSKSLELQLGRILRRGRILKNAMPETVEDFLGRWRREERVQRVWKADNSPEGGEKKLDEFTGTDE
ncbi:MAG: C39 family peptidase [Candidatus Nanohaloarchaea archaeon]|nr:C39 family peptidase [Candidatus Nanohaloarchaea archaeon]